MQRPNPETSFSDCCQTFAATYEVSCLPAMREVERSVLGCDYGGTSWTTRAQAQEIIATLGLGPGVTLLEIGAGSGWPGLYVADRSGCTVTLLDLPVSALGKAKARAAADGTLARVSAVAGSGEALPFGAATFEAISHSDVLCCLPGKATMLAECRRVAADGSRMLFSVISVPGGLSRSRRRLAVETGPPFAYTERSYPDLLAATGWRQDRVRDVTAEYAQSLNTLVRGLYDSPALRDALGPEAVDESIEHRETQLAAIGDGLLVREVYLATAA